MHVYDIPETNACICAVPKMQGVIYCTRSVYAVENEAVVIRSIEYVNGTTTKKCPFRVAPPVLPLSEQDIENGNLVGGKYLHFQPSCAMSGCFLATITREVSCHVTPGQEVSFCFTLRIFTLRRFHLHCIQFRGLCYSFSSALEFWLALKWAMKGILKVSCVIWFCNPTS